jgi:hypothetical protein
LSSLAEEGILLILLLLLMRAAIATHAVVGNIATCHVDWGYYWFLSIGIFR